MFSQNRGVEFMPNMATLLSRPPAIGRVFFVKLGGLDTNNGIDPGTPFLTITHALDQCVNGRNDYIIVLDYWQNDTVYPIDVNKSSVHIIGLDFGNGGPQWASPIGDFAFFTIGAAGYFEIAGFNFGAGATHACIESNVGAGPAEGRGIIHHCRFGWDQSAQDGIKVVDPEDLCLMDIHDNLFGGILSQDGIRCEGNSTRSLFHHNLFRNLPGIGIHCMKAGSDIAAIQDNVFKCPDLATGEAITMELTVGNALITGNQSMGQDNAVGFNPYRDLSVAGAGNALNGWGINYADITATLPIIT